MNKKYIPVKTTKVSTGTPLQSNHQYKQKGLPIIHGNREKMLSDKQRIDELEVKVDSLKDDISDIKNLLLKIVDK